MRTRAAITSIVVCILLLATGQTATAGKLGGLRSAARGEAKPTPRPAPRKTSTTEATPARQEAEEDQDEQPVRQASRTPPRQMDPQPTRKLQSIRNAVAPSPARNAPRRPAQRRPAPQHQSRLRHHRPTSRSPLTLRAHYSRDVCLPTVVEEHHYYPADPVVLQQPVYDVVPAAPVVIHAEPVPVIEEPIVIATEEVVVDPFDTLPPFQIRFEIDYAADEADVSRSGFGLLLNATGGLGIDTGVRMFQERDADFRDHLWMGDFNIVYELFPTQFSRTRAGVGVNWLADRFGSEGGFNMTLGTDLFAGPITFTGEVDLGTLGDADLIHGRLTAAIRQGENLEWFAGYDYLDVGGTEIRGIVGGLRFRF